MKDLLKEGEAAKKISPEQRLSTVFEFIEFSEALYEAGKKSQGDETAED